MEHYANQYVMVTVFLLVGIAFPVVVLWVGKQLRPRSPTPEKEIAYESGNDPQGDGQIRFNVRYYLYALMFVVFDVETVFLYPWAVAYKKLGLFALAEMMIFIGMLLIGLIYAWRKKVLQWNSI
ncbi:MULTISPECIES: NADH-quinone oxidoreductase subunit A [Cohnella]|uniref:NADH-quinone oxidoreductase subunit A n=1 Tax=Cohnella TaxID=329857 RepID=UPI000E38912A|nr:NADH-quinone oxidoreductase subunit A [Cohnella sp.]REK66537.1 MAG: NADH-quinone oxidoreductase subunit A [Cohnella sp.]